MSFLYRWDLKANWIFFFLYPFNKGKDERSQGSNIAGAYLPRRFWFSVRLRESMYLHPGASEQHSDQLFRQRPLPAPTRVPRAPPSKAAVAKAPASCPSHEHFKAAQAAPGTHVSFLCTRQARKCHFAFEFCAGTEVLFVRKANIYLRCFRTKFPLLFWAFSWP